MSQCPLPDEILLQACLLQRQKPLFCRSQPAGEFVREEMAEVGHESLAGLSPTGSPDFVFAGASLLAMGGVRCDLSLAFFCKLWRSPKPKIFLDAIRSPIRRTPQKELE